jgi:hypothetical protein
VVTRIIIASCFLLMASSFPSALFGAQWRESEQRFQPSLSDEFVSAKFCLVNDSDVRCKILEIKSSCGCTVASLDARTLMSGEEANLVTTFTFGDRIGLLAKTINVKHQVEGEEPKEEALKMVVDIPYVLRFERRFLSWFVGDEIIAKTAEIEYHETGLEQ